ncbi:hypothetical protein, partial [Mycoplasmoides pneumoniae]
ISKILVSVTKRNKLTYRLRNADKIKEATENLNSENSSFFFFLVWTQNGLVKETAISCCK